MGKFCAVRSLILFFILFFISNVSAQNSVTVEGSEVGGDVVGGNKTTINNNPREKSLLERVRGAWVISSYEHRPVVDGKQDPQWGPLLVIREGNAKLTVSETGRFFWEVTVHDGYRPNSEHRLNMTSTAQLKPSGELAPLVGMKYSSTHKPGGVDWQLSQHETQASIRGSSGGGPDDTFFVDTDTNGDFLEMKNSRSTYLWVRN